MYHLVMLGWQKDKIARWVRDAGQSHRVAATWVLTDLAVGGTARRHGVVVTEVEITKQNRARGAQRLSCAWRS